MNCQCSNYHCIRPRANSPFLPQLGCQKVSSRKGHRKMRLAVVKVLLLLVPMVLAGNLWLSSAFRNLELSVQEAKGVRQELIDTQFGLRAKRDRLYAPERIRMIAAEQLSLYVPNTDGR
jgi:hypothetical protein